MTAKKRRRKTPVAAPCAGDVWARTQLLVEVLLEVMEKEIRAPESERSEQWVKLFGAKDSAVVNLQKLVQLLAALQGEKPLQKDQAADTVPVDAEELAILEDWLRTNGANVSPAAE